MDLKLNNCCRCGGKGQLHTEYIETASGYKQFLGLCCSGCNARTTLYMCDNKDDPDVLNILKDLWNRGRVSS